MKRIFITTALVLFSTLITLSQNHYYWSGGKKLYLKESITKYIVESSYNDILTMDKLSRSENVTLFMREDAAIELINYYTKFEPSTAKQKSTLIEKGKYSYQISAFELLLAQNEVIKILTLEQKKQLLSESIRKLKSKQDNKDVYGMQSYNYTAIIMARLLDDEGFEPFMKYKGENAEIESFIKTVNCHSNAMINSIYNVAIQYINQ